ncbi:tetratricopeptide repeat protein [Massilia violaceinigra]|uniref:Tetratricopeptide repeat protein n=1 Tax=Massilia violaceinigra TaxID=2045208 RepID=A0ABY4AAY9_9BURK|nr:tetratricopeptide repeat protein [Massilia violaceinigra]UOD31952.1 tetratricopeptide repeat protein [Massilia violaceinigra]
MLTPRLLPLASILLCVLGLAACTTEPVRPREVQLTEEPGESGPRCSGPDCCADAEALEFVPQRQYCSALALDNEGKAPASASALKDAIAGARAEKIRTHDASGVLCHAYALEAQRAGDRGDGAAARSGLAAAVQACRAGFGNESNQAAQAMLDSAEQRLQNKDESAKVGEELGAVLALARKNVNAQIEADATDALGRLKGLAGDVNAERRLLTEGMEMRRKAYGENSYQTGMSYVNLGGSYMRVNDNQAGRAWYERAIAVYGTTLGMADPVTLEVRAAHAMSYSAERNHKRAQELLEAMLPQAVQTFGAQSEDTVAIINDIGNMQQHQGQSQAALLRYEEVLAIRRATMPDTVKHGRSALLAATLKHKIAGCAASGALDAEVRRIAAHLEPSVAKDEDARLYVREANDVVQQCAAPAARTARKQK